MRSPVTRALPSSVLVGAVLVGAARPPRRGAPEPPAPPTRGTFALMLGSDTVATERFTRSADRLEAELAGRGSAGIRASVHYEAVLRPDASMERFVGAIPGAPVASVTFQGDSAIVTRGADTVRRAVPRGAVLYINPSPSLMEQIVRRARALGGTRGGPAQEVPVLVSGAGGQTAMAAVTFPAADSAQLVLGPATVLLRVDAAGAVLGGSVPGQGVTISRSVDAR